MHRSQLDGWDYSSTFLNRADVVQVKRFKDMPLGSVWAYTWAEQFPDDEQAAINEGAGFVQFFEPNAADLTHCAHAEKWCVAWSTLLTLLGRAQSATPSSQGFGMVTLVLDYLYGTEHEVTIEELTMRMKRAAIAFDYVQAVPHRIM